MAIRPVQSTFSVSVLHYGVRLMICFMAAIACLIMIYWPPIRSGLLTVAATLVLTWLVWLMAHFFRLMFGMKPSLEMDEIGITDRRSALKSKFIAWHTIIACETDHQKLLLRTSINTKEISSIGLKSSAQNIQKVVQRFIAENKIELADE